MVTMIGGTFPALSAATWSSESTIAAAGPSFSSRVVNSKTAGGRHMLLSPTGELADANAVAERVPDPEVDTVRLLSGLVGDVHAA